MQEEPTADAAAGPGPGSSAGAERVVKRYRRAELDDEEEKHDFALSEGDGDG